MRLRLSFLLATFIFLIKNEHIKCQSSETIFNPYFHFPGGSDAFMGLIVAIAIPLEAGTPGDIVLTAILEANYLMPTNETQFEYPPIVGDATDSAERTFLYEIFIRKLEDFGYSGKNCLLRTICEAAQISTVNTGVLGDIVHLILTPSASKTEKKLQEYMEAEIFGSKRGCKHYRKLCPYSILNAISKIKLFPNQLVHDVNKI